MGVELVKVVLSATWAHLTPAASRLFAVMAITALDRDRPETPGQPAQPARRYYGGHERLVLALDGRLRDPGRELEAQYRRVRRLLDQLRQAGAIVPVRTARHGQHAEYELVVLGAKEVTQRPPSLPDMEGNNSPAEEGRNSPPSAPKGGQKLPGKEGRNSPPKEERGTTRAEDLPEDRRAQVSRPVADRAREPGDPPAGKCAECGRPEPGCRAHSARRGGHEYRSAGAA